MAAELRTFVPAPQRASTKGTRSAPSTMARWAGPMTPSGTRRWKGRGSDGAGWGTSSSLASCGSCGGTPSPGAPGPEREVVKPPPGGWLWPEPGARWVLLKQSPPESEGPQEGLAVPGGFTGGRMVGEQGRHIRHGTGAWQPFYSGSSTHFSLKWIGTSSLWMTGTCGCFEARGQ